MPGLSTKQANFERLAERRVSEAIKKIHSIGKLANRNNYSYTDEHVKQVIDAIESELKVIKAKFRGEISKEVSFSFRVGKK